MKFVNIITFINFLFVIDIMEPQTYSFLSRKSFDRISEKHVNQRKINRNLMDINHYDECLKYPSLQHDSKLKYWITNTFKILRICMTEELHLLKRDENNLGTQVCPIENFYEVICCASGDRTWRPKQKPEKKYYFCCYQY